MSDDEGTRKTRVETLQIVDNETQSEDIQHLLTIMVCEASAKFTVVCVQGTTLCASLNVRMCVILEIRKSDDVEFFDRWQKSGFDRCCLLDMQDLSRIPTRFRPQNSMSTLCSILSRLACRCEATARAGELISLSTFTMFLPQTHHWPVGLSPIEVSNAVHMAIMTLKVF